MTTIHNTKDAIAKKFYEAADSADFDRWFSFFDDNSQIIFGNDAPVIGKEACRTFYSGFFQVIEKMTHHVVHTYVIDGGFICEINVDYYVKGDPEKVTLNISCTSMMDDDSVLSSSGTPTKPMKKLSVYYDPSPVKAKIHKYVLSLAPPTSTN